MKQALRSILIFLVLLLTSFAYGQKPESNKLLEIIPDEKEAHYRFENMRISKETGVPLALYHVNYTIKEKVYSPEEMARIYLSNNAALLQIDPQLDNIVHRITRETPGGYHVRFYQAEQGFPVYGSSIVVNIDRKQTVNLVMNSVKPGINLSNPHPGKTNTEALQIAQNYLSVDETPYLEKMETVAYYNAGESRLAHKILLGLTKTNRGEWEVLVDAHSGEIFRVFDQTLYRDGHEENVDGSGWVFDPDPLTSSGASYGGSFGDNNDGDTDELTAQLVQVTLPDITFDGTTYELTGPYAEIVDWDGPFKGTFSQDSSNWHFTRSNDAFEAANVYFHIDHSMRYINETLGFTLLPYQYSGGVQVDPHGWNGADNSSYSPGSGRLTFGEGGVDDAEDADVVLHELGHGLHDWLTAGGLSQVDGLSEGCGDYWASSYNRSKGFWTPSDPEYYWMFHWDGHNPFWGGRVINYSANYPSGLSGSIHTDGQMWASTLMSIYDEIGREATDLNFLEGLAMTNGSSSQEDAAQAFIQADLDLHGGANLTVIEFWFTQRGYDVTVPTPNIGHTPLSDTENVDGPYSVRANITAAFPLETVQLIYGTDESFTDTLDMVFEGENSYAADIPGTGSPANYNYYILAADSADLASTLPAGAPVNYYSFSTGADATPPVISHTAIAGVSLFSLPVDISAIVTDNIGVDSVWVEYQIEDNPLEAFTMDHSSGDVFTGTMNLDSNQVMIGDEISYRIWAVDLSSLQNTAVLPADTGFYTFIIQNVLTTTRVSQIPIPDDNPTGITDTFTVNVPEGQIIGDMDFIFKAQHSWVGDLIVEVTNPTGVTLRLIDRPGLPASQFGSSANDPDVILDDAAETSIEDISFGGNDPVIGTFRPSPDALSDLNGTEAGGTWSIMVSDNEGQDTGALQEWGFIFSLEAVTGIDDDSNLELPQAFQLHENYPNPFNPSTTLRYDLKESVNVQLMVYNILGQQVRTLVNGAQTAGRQSINWDGRDDLGRQVSSGIYIYRLLAGDFVQSRKMMLMK